MRKTIGRKSPTHENKPKRNQLAKILLQSQKLHRVPLTILKCSLITMQQNAIKITNCHFVFPHQKFIPGSVEKALKQHLYLNVGYLNLQNNSKLNKI